MDPQRKKPARRAVSEESGAMASGKRDFKIPARAGGNLRVEAVMKVAERSGLIAEKTSRIGGRISADLVNKAKEITGIESDSELIAFALANLALEDRFSITFKETKGAVDPELKLGY